MAEGEHPNNLWPPHGLYVTHRDLSDVHSSIGALEATSHAQGQEMKSSESRLNQRMDSGFGSLRAEFLSAIAGISNENTALKQSQKMGQYITLISLGLLAALIIGKDPVVAWMTRQ